MQPSQIALGYLNENQMHAVQTPLAVNQGAPTMQAVQPSVQAASVAVPVYAPPQRHSSLGAALSMYDQISNARSAPNGSAEGPKGLATASEPKPSVNATQASGQATTPSIGAQPSQIVANQPPPAQEPKEGKDTFERIGDVVKFVKMFYGMT